MVAEEKELVTFEEAVVKPKPLNVSNTKKETNKKKKVHTDGIPKDSWDSLKLRNPAVYPKRSSLVK